ncbi:uncharacterized protein F5147DRAFT_781573 [Suillus discolor]|uniref:Ribonuclease H1 N-terminal domain-containing protein n=1 Tax=Suillus discolor TaxID=1912936 RepID=A0A9P7ERG7_9AGAM|nr:uncharacterized protein F5147DRAFT_781573 [Suillus discolor]KAG2086586.1 hypothetical protein F5147DRAFT_781573 [Suillus discolor]
MTSNNPSSVSSSHAVDALVTALMNLNMSSVTAHALVTIIQAIADGGQTIPSAAVHPGQKDHTADCDVEDNADEGAEATPASTTTPPLSSTTLAPDIGSIAEAIAKLSLCNNADLVGTNADLVGLPPRSVSYKGFPYEIPDLSAEGPFYCVIKGKRVGVLATWEDTSPQVTGVSGAIHSRCPSVEVGIARIHAAIERNNCQYLGA